MCYVEHLCFNNLLCFILKLFTLLKLLPCELFRDCWQSHFTHRTFETYQYIPVGGHNSSSMSCCYLKVEETWCDEVLNIVDQVVAILLIVGQRNICVSALLSLKIKLKILLVIEIDYIRHLKYFGMLWGQLLPKIVILDGGLLGEKSNQWKVIVPWNLHIM